jgi:hypothetical protein
MPGEVTQNGYKARKTRAYIFARIMAVQEGSAGVSRGNAAVPLPAVLLSNSATDGKASFMLLLLYVLISPSLWRIIRPGGTPVGWKRLGGDQNA